MVIDFGVFLLIPKDDMFSRKTYDIPSGLSLRLAPKLESCHPFRIYFTR